MPDAPDSDELFKDGISLAELEEMYDVIAAHPLQTHPGFEWDLLQQEINRVELFALAGVRLDIANHETYLVFPALEHLVRSTGGHGWVDWERICPFYCFDVHHPSTKREWTSRVLQALRETEDLLLSGVCRVCVRVRERHEGARRWCNFDCSQRPLSPTPLFAPTPGRAEDSP